MSAFNYRNINVSIKSNDYGPGYTVRVDGEYRAGIDYISSFDRPTAAWAMGAAKAKIDRRYAKKARKLAKERTAEKIISEAIDGKPAKGTKQIEAPAPKPKKRIRFGK